MRSGSYRQPHIGRSRGSAGFPLADPLLGFFLFNINNCIYNIKYDFNSRLKISVKLFTHALPPSDVVWRGVGSSRARPDARTAIILLSDAIILLKTNVVSELMRPKPAQTVLDWFAAQDSTKLLFSAVSVPELYRPPLSTSWAHVLPFDSA